MINKNGDIFTTELSVIGHGVNVDGLMGAGIAKQFQKLFPFNYRVYQSACKTKGLLPGDCLIVNEQGDIYVVNLASQDRPGPNATYAWLTTSVVRAVRQLQSIRINSMAIPEIGCGIGGLEWPVVQKRLLLIERATGFEFEVWHYEG